MVHLLYVLSDLAQYVQQNTEQRIERHVAQSITQSITQSSEHRSTVPGLFTPSVPFAVPLSNWMKRSVQRFNRSY